MSVLRGALLEWSTQGFSFLRLQSISFVSIEGITNIKKSRILSRLSANDHLNDAIGSYKIG